jgi:hypothetical protein
MALPKPGCAGWFASMIALVLAVVLGMGATVTVAQSEPPIRTIRAGHILVSPGHDPAGAMDLDAEDPGWAVAEAEASEIAEELRAIDDPDARSARFAALARDRSDDRSSGAVGGDLGTFSRDMMVPEFADPLFEAVDPAPGDVLGPVRSDFGWHVILYQGEGEPIPPDDGGPFEEAPTPAPTPGLTLVDPGAEPRSMVRFIPAPGRATLLMTLTDASTIEIEGVEPVRTAATTTMTWEVATLPAGADGRIRTELRLRDASIDATQGPDLATGLARDEIERMIGMSGWTVTDSSGRVVDSGIDVPEDLDPTIARSFQALFDGYTDLPATFPDVPMGLGAEWRSVTISPATELATGSVGETTSRLIARDGTSVTTEVDIRSTQDSGQITFPGLPDGTLVFVIGGNGSGTGRMTMDLGGLAMEGRTSATGRTEMLVQAGEQVIAMTLASKSEMTVTTEPAAVAR